MMLLNSCTILLALGLPLVQALTTKSRSATPRFTNTSSISSTTSNADPTVCCFAFQSTVTADWWELSSLRTINLIGANVTSILTYYTLYEDTGDIVTRYENVTKYNVSTTTVSPVLAGKNPIFIQTNAAAYVPESTVALTGTATVTGGVTMQSPAAFYVYTTVEIITASPVLDGERLVCGTTSSNPALGVVYTGINENAQSIYYGGLREAGVEIALETPFVYAPARGSAGATKVNTCEQGGGPEDYGYLPQTVLDFLVQNEKYSSQYPGLATCLPGGPAIESVPCGLVMSTITDHVTFGTIVSEVVTVVPVGTQGPPAEYRPTAVGGQLTESKQIYATVQGKSDPQAGKPTGGGDRTLTPTGVPSNNDGNQKKPPDESNKDPTNGNTDPQNKTPQDGGQQQPTDNKNPTDGNSKTPPDGGQQQPTDNKNPADGNNGTPQNGGQQQNDNKNPTDGSNKTPTDGGQQQSDNKNPGDGSNKTPQQNGGNPGEDNQGGSGGGKQTGGGNDENIGFIIDSIMGGQPTQAQPGGQPGGQPKIAPTAAPQVGNPTFIDGTPMVVIPGPTNIPLSDAPKGLQGSTQVIDGKSFLVVPAAVTFQPQVGSPIVVGPTNIPLADAPKGLQGSTQVVDGTSFLVVPAAVTFQPAGPSNIVIGPTSILLSDAPPGLQGSTQVVDGKSFLVVTSPATIQVAPAGNRNHGVTTFIDGVPFLLIPGPTSIPIAGAPDVPGKTTFVDGTPFLELPGTVTVPLNSAGSYGSTTLVDGTPYLAVGPTLVPVKGAPPGLEGKTTLINGTPFLQVTASTQVPLIGSNTVVDGSSYLVVGPTSIPLSNAPSGLTGKTTMINGTPYLVVPSQTSIEVTPSEVGQLTVIMDGTSRLIISGPTTIPVNPNFSIDGKTTVIDGTTMVVVSSKTTVKGKADSTSSSTSSTTTSSSLPAPSQTTKKSGAGVRLGPEMWMVTVFYVVLAG